MKDELTLQQLLCLKQDDIAMILQVTRAKWSMYVSGKRNLPAEAKLKLAEIINFVNQNQNNFLESFENNLSR